MRIQGAITFPAKQVFNFKRFSSEGDEKKYKHTITNSRYE